MRRFFPVKQLHCSKTLPRDFARKSFGLICRKNNRGLGAEIRHLEKIFAEHIPEVTFSVFYFRGVKRADLDAKLIASDGFQRWVSKQHFIMAIEDFLPNVFAECRSQGIKTFWRPNHEWINPALSRRDFEAVDVVMTPQSACAELLVSRFSLKNIINNPWITALPVLEKEPSVGMVSFLFNAGAGGVGDRRNAAAVIDAFAKVLDERKDVKLIIKTQKDLDIAKLARFDRNQFLYICGNASYEKNLEYYSGADFSVAPSKWEGVGFSILESLYCGTPVLTVDAPPMSEWVSHKETGYLVPARFSSASLPIKYSDENLVDGLNWIKAANSKVDDVVSGIYWLVDNRFELYRIFNLKNRAVLKNRERHFVQIFRDSLPARESPPDLAEIRLAIIEIDYHAEVLEKIVRLLAGANFKITLYISTKVKQKLRFDESVWDKLNYFVCSKKTSADKFLQDNRDNINSNDLVYFNTIERNYATFHGLNLTAPYIVCAHNINTDFFPRESIDRKRKTILHISFYILSRVMIYGQWRRKEVFLNKAKGIFCCSQSISKYLVERNNHWLEKVVDFPLPYIWSDTITDFSRFDPPIDGIVRVVLPGSVNVNRKDYDVIHSALQEVIPLLENKLELIFLGRPVANTGLATLKKFAKLSNEMFSFKGFDNGVKSEVFERTLSEADFILGSVKIRTSRKIYIECYGLSKISGIESDIVSSQRPALINADYSIDNRLSDVCETYYDSDDLAAKLLRWVNTSEFLVYQEKFNDLDDYRAGLVLDRFTKYCESIRNQRVSKL